MRKLTHVLKIKPLLIFILLVTGICFAQTDFPPEDSIAAKFCFYADTSRQNGQLMDSVWNLSVYEQVVPLTVTIQTNSPSYDSYFNAKLISDESPSFSLNFADHFYPGGGCFAMGSNGKRYRCSVDVNEEYAISNLFSFFYEFKDSVKVPKLFGKVLPLEWHLDFSMGKQKQTLSGTHYVYVSGFCNEEQREEIKELRKEQEERKQKLKKEEEQKRIQKKNDRLQEAEKKEELWKKQHKKDKAPQP